MPEAVIDRLAIEVSADASAASQNILQLAEALSKLGFTATATHPKLDTTKSDMDSVAASSNKAASSVSTLGGVFSGVKGKVLAFGAAWMTFKKTIGGAVNEVNTYIENMNLFEASMGKYTDDALKFAETVQDAMGVDMGEWARNQGVFMTLATGMGVTADRASVMSQQLTQLGYDISSFYNMRVNDAMLKIQSGIAGELEPLRRIGWDLSDTRLQAEAAALGISKSTREMTQAEKVALRYHLIMTQVTQTHGDMARTIMSPANQLRILQAQLTITARAIGDLFIPALNMILPYAIGAVKAIRLIAQEVANFFGINAEFKVDYSGLDTSGIATGNEDLADSMDDVSDSTSKATKKAKEYKNTVMGFDELNKLNDIPDPTDLASDSSKDDGKNLGDITGLIPIDTYDFMKDLKDQLGKDTDEIAKKIRDNLKKLLPVIGAVGAGFLAWKLGPNLLKSIGKVSGKLGGLGKDGKKAGKLMSVIPEGFIKGVGPWIGAFAIVGAHFTNLAINSENFQKGIKQIWEWLQKIPEALSNIGNPFEGISGFLKELGREIKQVFSEMGIDISPIMEPLGQLMEIFGQVGSKVNEVFDLQWSDAMMVAAGVTAAVIGGPVGTAIAGFILVLEGVSLAIRAIGWATSPCVESIDALAGVSEETAERFGTSLKSMEDATRELDTLDFGNSVVSAEDVESIKAKIEDIEQTIVENLNGERNEELKELHSLAGVFTPEEMQSVEQRINEYYDGQIAAATNGSDQINQILANAAAENRSLTEEESAQIQQIKDSMYQQLVESAGATKEELDAINEAMKNNNSAAAVEAASAAIKAAKERKEEVVKSANEEYNDVVKWAKQMYDANEISKERYDEIVEQAKTTAEEQKNAAADGYDKTIKETKDKLGELSNNIDYDTGEIRSKWDVEWENISKKVGEVLGDIKDDYQKWEKDTGKNWNRFWKDAGKNWDGFWKGVGKGAGKWLGNAKSDFERWQKDLSTGWDDFWRGIGQGWEQFKENIKLPHIRIEGYIDVPMLGTIPDPMQMYVDWYARGGFPDTGQLFMAREAGPEMVGTIGGRTAVANNDQIVAGIRNGVFDAMVSAAPMFRQQEGGSVELVLRVDSKTLARAVNDGNAKLAAQGLVPTITFA